MNFREKLMQERFNCFELPQPADITNEHWAMAKQHAQISGQKLSKEVEQSCFYYYIMDDSWEDISTKLELPMGILIYTALCYKWHEKKNALSTVKPGSKIKKAEMAAVDLVTDSIVATAAVYKHKLAEIIKNPELASSCPLIPRNMKELSILLQLLDISQPKQPLPMGGSVNVNIANLPGRQPMVEIGGNTFDALPAAEEAPDEDRLEVLRLLQKVKVV